MKDITIENQVELREIVDFKVDSSACVKCGACVRDCAFLELAGAAS